MNVRAGVAALGVSAVLLVGCAARTPAPRARTGAAAQPYDAAALPSGPLGAAIREGRALIMQTPSLMKPYVRAQMSCAACHIAGGTVARGGTLVGTYARFPAYNKRAHRVITLQDRIAECFLYSMNGKVPPYEGRAMTAMVAYIAWLSRGVATRAPRAPDASFKVRLPARAPDIAAGKALYAQRCALCHQAGGEGVAGTFPPLWGPTSFNTGAGMAHLSKMTGFVRYNMPKNAPGSLTVAQAYDVAAFVLAHARPVFAGGALQHSGATHPAKFY